MHLIRNSVDHGIEDQDKRKRLSKPEQGRILLEARNSGGEVIINVVDDGAGLDKDKIINKALKVGLIKSSDGISDKDAFSLILQPGFSTKEQVTEFSGRGVGMDVVKKGIDKIGGSIQKPLRKINRRHRR
jgi:two-component system chemotaxis sensor kinase CheA